MDFTWLGRGPANHNECFRTKGLYYRQKYSSALSAVWVASLRRSRMWRSQMWRSWDGVVTHGLRLKGWLDILPNSLKQLWRRLAVEKIMFNSLTPALVDMLAVSTSIAWSLKTCDICGIVLCDKSAHFSGFLLSPVQGAPVEWSCSLISFLICFTCQVDGLSWQMRNAH
jgi:hypothetical protein